MQHMEKASLYNVDSNRPATAKQCYALGRHFGKLHGATPAEAFRLSKVFAAILLKFNAEHSNTPITHGDVSRFFELDKVPAKFLERITVRAPTKTSKKSAAKKTSKKSEAKPQPKVEDTPKASDSSLTDFKARLDALASKQAETDKKLASIDAKMDLIMAFLETNPDA